MIANCDGRLRRVGRGRAISRRSYVVAWSWGVVWGGRAVVRGVSSGVPVSPPGAAVPSVGTEVSSKAVVIVMSSVVEQAVLNISTARTDMMQELLFLRIIMASISTAVETVIR